MTPAAGIGSSLLGPVGQNPPRLARYLSQCADRDPARIVFDHATVMIADIVGFTEITSRLASERGRSGSEVMAAILNRRIGSILDRVDEHGGEVATLGGDAVVAYWSIEAGGQQASRSAATICAAAIHDDMRRLDDRDGEPIVLHIGIGCGSMVAAALGGLDGRYEIVVDGPAAQAAWRATSRALPGATVVEESVRTLATLAGEPHAATAAGDDDAASSPYATGEEWLAESRQLTALFCRIEHASLETADDARAASQCVRSIQEIAQGSGGMLDKVLVEGGHLTAILLFGVRLAPTERAAVAAVSTGLSLAGSLAAMSVPASVGIASGRAFCGFFGNDARRNYTAVGDPLNIAARLCRFSPSSVVTDGATATLVRPDFQLHSIGHPELRGLADGLAAFLVESEAHGPEPSSLTPLIGRERELAELSRLLLAGEPAAEARVTVVEGEPGIGKSRLLAEAVSRVRDIGVDVLIGAGQEGDQGRPYSIWRAILSRLTEVDAEGFADLPPLTAATAGEDAWLLHLFVPMAGARSLDGQRASATTTEARGEQIEAGLVGLIGRWLGGRRCVLALEDLHWVDEASLRVAARLSGDAANVRLVVTARSGEAAGLARLRKLGLECDVVTLQGLMPDDTSRLLGGIVGVDGVSRSLVERVQRRSGGNPLFIEELSLSLRFGDQSNDGGVGTIDALPPRLEAVVTSRIDRLSPAAQIAVKVASVMGDRIDAGALGEISREWLAPEDLARALSELERAHILLAEAEVGDGLTFRHDLCRQIAYDLLVDVQRRRIHGAYAAWLTSRRPADGHDDPLSIGRHWIQANRPDLAKICLEQAAVQALADGALSAARSNITLMLEVSASAPDATSQWRGRWYQVLASCAVALGDLAQGARYASTAIREFGIDVPASRIGWAFTLAREILRHLPHFLRRRDPPSSVAESTRSEVGHVVGAINAYTEAVYFSGDALALLTLNLTAINHAESAGLPQAVARSYGVVGYIVGLARLRGLALRYFERPRAACRQAGDIVGEHSTLGGEAMLHLSFGRWREARAAAGRAIELCRQARDPHDLELALTLAGLGATYEGRYRESSARFDEVFNSARARLDPHHMAWGCYAIARNLLATGDATEALRRLQEARRYLASVDDVHSQLNCEAISAAVFLRLRDFRRAREAAIRASHLARRLVPNNFGTLEGYSLSAWVLLALWARSKSLDPTEARRMRALASGAVRAMRRYARLFPIGRPWLLVLEGWHHLHDGHRGAAVAAWSAARSAAERLAMPLEQSLAELALGLVGRPEIGQPPANPDGAIDRLRAAAAIHQPMLECMPPSEQWARA